MGPFVQSVDLNSQHYADGGKEEQKEGTIKFLMVASRKDIGLDNRIFQVTLTNWTRRLSPW